MFYFQDSFQKKTELKVIDEARNIKFLLKRIEAFTFEALRSV